MSSRCLDSYVAQGNISLLAVSEEMKDSACYNDVNQS